MGRFFAVLVLAAVLGGGLAWQLDLFPHSKADDPKDDQTSYLTSVKPELLGDKLYVAEAPMKLLANQERRGADPIIVAGKFEVIEKMDACAQAPGQILFVGQEIPEGTAQVAGLAALLQGKVYSALVDLGDVKYYKLYFRLTEGDIIGEHEMAALVNPAKTIHAILEKDAKLKSAEAEESATKKMSIAAQRRFELENKLYIKQVSSEKDREDAFLTSTKTQGDYEVKTEGTNVARLDLKKEKLLLNQHRVVNLLPVKMSIIKTVYKHTGEAVKELEPVLQLYAIDKLNAEGLVELQFANRLVLGKKVIIEPTRDSSPLRVWRSHKKEITAVTVAYTGAAARPLAASASEDGTVCLWDEEYAGPIGLLAHSQPVKSLACSPRGADKHLLLAGLADGSVAIWDLDAFKRESQNKPLKILKEHAYSVTALAFSPDGHYFATGSSDGSIFMWDAKSDGSDYRLYPFDATHGVSLPHSGEVTALHFTPQCTLVSAARDNTLRVWELRKKGAMLVSEPIPGRSDTIRALGVSRDGSTMLFDQGKTLQFLSPDGRAVATLQKPGGSTSFQTFAEFSPDASMILTAGDDVGRLQLWKAPTDGKRGFELRQFVSSEKSDVTSAAFFDPNPTTNEIPFAISGAKDGVVYLWPLPTRDDVQKHRIENVILTQINQGVETRQIRIGVEVPNSEERKLIPGQPVTIVIE